LVEWNEWTQAYDLLPFCFLHSPLLEKDNL